MVDMVDYFVIKVSFDGNDVVVGRYVTFNEADDIAGDLLTVEDVDSVRVEFWSSRIARRYGLPIERVRVEKLLSKLREIEVKRKRREMTADEAVMSIKKTNRLLMKVLNDR